MKTDDIFLISALNVNNYFLGLFTYETACLHCILISKHWSHISEDCLWAPLKMRLSQEEVKSCWRSSESGLYISYYNTLQKYLSEPGPKSSKSCPGTMKWVWVSRSEGRPGPSQPLRGHGDQIQHHLKTHKNPVKISYKRARHIWKQCR